MIFLSKKNKKYFLAIISIFIFPFGKNANPDQNYKHKAEIQINGEPETTSVSDIPLPKNDFDFDSFDSGFQPDKELINLLDNPTELTGIEEKEFALEFLSEN